MLEVKCLKFDFRRKEARNMEECWRSEKVEEKRNARAQDLVPLTEYSVRLIHLKRWEA